MHSIDYSIILLYFLIVILFGFWYQKRASKNLESYFLGGKNIHWLPLAMSGSVSTFDITGTMWIVSILFVLGMKSMWHHWMWGVYMAAFFMAYMGKWVRRSNVMTAAEWMKTRFGEDTGGRLARTAYAIMAIVTLTSFIGYAYQGIGKFASVYISLEPVASLISNDTISQFVLNHQPDILAIVVMGITTLYVILGGLYSVVVTDVIQTTVLTLGSVFIAYIAWSKLNPELLSVLPQDWTSLKFSWTLTETATNGHAEFEFFGLLVIVWVLKGFLLNAGGPAQMFDFQRFLAARNPRDAAKVGAAWSFFLIVRWAMATGIALLALVGITGVTDSEKVMPIVLLQYLPTGIRGLVIAGLLAAFMSTFSSIVNSGASFIVRDIWEQYIRPHSTVKESIKTSYAASLLIVLIGLVIGFNATSIAQIWDWIMMALGAAIVVPNVLRWYWWRLNGWGYSIGTFSGVILSVVVLFYPSLPVYIIFPSICLISLASSIIVSYFTKPVKNQILLSFFEQVRPFGLWGPIKKLSALSMDDLHKKSESGRLALLNVLLAMVAVSGLYLGPMYLVGHWYTISFTWFFVSAGSIFVLKFTWYNHLPDPKN
jgi:solute:Na+ symporter, SSS family